MMFSFCSPISVELFGSLFFVEKASSEDVEDFYRVVMSSTSSWSDDLSDLRNTVADSDRYLRVVDSSLVLKVSSGLDAVAFCSLRVSGHGDGVLLSMLHVVPEFQAIGLGSFLLDLRLELAESSGFSYAEVDVASWNDVSISSLESKGFVVSSSKENPFDCLGGDLLTFRHYFNN